MNGDGGPLEVAAAFVCSVREGSVVAGAVHAEGARAETERRHAPEEERGGGGRAVRHMVLSVLF